MPGPHVEQAFEEAFAKLQYKPIPAAELKDATPEVQRDDAFKKDKARGTDVFNEIEGNANLTPSEKQEVFQRLAREGVDAEKVKAGSQSNTLMRTDSQMTNFMSAYMKAYAGEFLEVVKQAGVEAAGNVELPGSVDGKQIMHIGAPIDGVSPGDMEKLNEIYVDVAGKMLDAAEQNLDKLSPEARGFLQAAMEPVAANEEASNIAMAGTLLLRGAAPAANNEGVAMQRQPGGHNMGAVIKNASAVLQSYANAINRAPGTSSEIRKPQNELADRMRTPQALDQSKRAFQAVVQGGDSVEQYVEQRKKVAADERFVPRAKQIYDERKEEMRRDPQNIMHPDLMERAVLMKENIAQKQMELADLKADHRTKKAAAENASFFTKGSKSKEVEDLDTKIKQKEAEVASLLLKQDDVLSQAMMDQNPAIQRQAYQEVMANPCPRRAPTGKSRRLSRTL